MAQKLLVKVAGKQDVKDKLRLLLVGEPQLRRDFVHEIEDEPLWIRFDDSVDDLASYSSHYIRAESSDDLKSVADALRNSDSYTTVAVDTVEQLQRVLLNERLKREKRDHIKGDDYNWMASMMNAIIESLNGLGVHVILLSGPRYSRDDDSSFVSPNIFGSFAEQVYSLVDYAFAVVNGYESSVNEDLEVESEPCVYVITESSPKYSWVFDSSGHLKDVEGVSIDSLISSRQEFVEQLEESDSFELIIPDDDDNVELPKGMSKADKIQKLLDKGASNKENKEK